MKKEEQEKPRVYVYGGGVAGLTAAHELVIRGFEVHLYERERALGPRGKLESESLGGMARTQYFSTSKGNPLYFRAGLGEETPGIGEGVQAEQYFPECWLEFLEDSSQPESPKMSRQSEKILGTLIDMVNNWYTLGYFKTTLGRQSDIGIYIQTFVDASDRAIRESGNLGAGESGTRALNMVHAVREILCEKRSDGEVLKQELQQCIVPVDENNPENHLQAFSGFGAAPVSRNWVRVLFYRPQLPGEHGYRFFPSYYRHVFDTMARIPLQNEQGRPTGGSVLDNLVPLPEIGIANNTRPPFLLSWNSPQTGDVRARAEYNRRGMADLNIRTQDLFQFSLRVLRYMLSCPGRRAKEMEALSWWQYLEGHDPAKGTRLYSYSPAFAHLVKSSSRVLAAMDGEFGDARTCGNTYVQLLTQALVPTPRGNCTLNGPTSEAWFAHWRTHLERLGVRFFQGELESLQVDGDARLVATLECESGPRFRPHGTGEDGEPKDIYFVVATDLLSAARATAGLQGGIPTPLQRYALEKPLRQGDLSRGLTPWPEQEFDRSKSDRLQTISGIQFFFEKHVNVVDGYLYCVDAEWGLSAICSQLVWKDRPISSLSAYQSILSVDIGDWNTPSQVLKKRAWECSPRQLRDEVLRQLRASLSARGQGKTPAAFVLPEPDWTHIDESLVYEPIGDGEQDPLIPRKLLGNRTPYLVPIAGDWKNRPGPEPWDPTPEAAAPPAWPHFTGSVWQAPQGGYPVHQGRLVFAGTWLRTFTRMTTMESANESARHAVNAILDHRIHHRLRATEASDSSASSWQSPGTPGSFNANPYQRGFFPTTELGDYCRIWNPEINELPDLELLQKQDDEAFRHHRPHPMDALGLEILPSYVSQVPGIADSFETLLRWAGTLGTTLPHASQGLLAVLRQLRTMMEGAQPPPRSPPRYD